MDWNDIDRQIRVQVKTIYWAQAAGLVVMLGTLGIGYFAYVEKRPASVSLMALLFVVQIGVIWSLQRTRAKLIALRARLER